MHVLAMRKALTAILQTQKGSLTVSSSAVNSQTPPYERCKYRHVNIRSYLQCVFLEGLSIENNKGHVNSMEANQTNHKMSKQ